LSPHYLSASFNLQGLAEMSRF